MYKTKEEAAAQVRQWRANNLEKYKERARVYARKWREKNPEKQKVIRQRSHQKAKLKVLTEQERLIKRRKNNEAMARYRAKHPEKIRELQRQWHHKNRERRILSHRCRVHGITVERFKELLEVLDHKCPVCGTKIGANKDSFIDHCHKTGMVRGILCKHCNSAEGLLKTPQAALRLYEYMIKNELFYQSMQ